MRSAAYDPFGGGGNSTFFNASDYNFSDFNFSDFDFGNFSFPTRRLSAADFILPDVGTEPIDILTADLFNFTDKEIQDIILGKIMYDIIALRDTTTPLH